MYPGMDWHSVCQRVPTLHFLLYARQDELLQQVVQDPLR